MIGNLQRPAPLFPSLNTPSHLASCPARFRLSAVEYYYASDALKSQRAGACHCANKVTCRGFRSIGPRKPNALLPVLVQTSTQTRRDAALETRTRGQKPNILLTPSDGQKRGAARARPGRSAAPQPNPFLLLLAPRPFRAFRSGIASSELFG